MNEKNLNFAEFFKGAFWFMVNNLFAILFSTLFFVINYRKKLIELDRGLTLESNYITFDNSNAMVSSYRELNFDAPDVNNIYGGSEDSGSSVSPGMYTPGVLWLWHFLYSVKGTELWRNRCKQYLWRVGGQWILSVTWYVYMHVKRDKQRASSPLIVSRNWTLTQQMLTISMAGRRTVDPQGHLVCTLCPKSPSVRGFVASISVRLLFKSI